ncbi:MAG: glycosyltransferase family A protein, partial [Acidobacteriota bacterium]
MTRLTIGITTRNRVASLERCLRSLQVLEELQPRVLVFDDGSDLPVTDAVAAALPAGMDGAVLPDGGGGYIVGRNRIMQAAATPYVLMLDDDTVVLTAASVRAAMAVMDGDATVAAVAFAQAEADG